MLSVKTKVKVVKPKTPKAVYEKYMGKEPVPESVFRTEMDVIKVFNYYNYFNDLKTAITFVESYLKSVNDPRLKLFKKAPSHKVPTTIGWIARLLQRKCSLPKHVVEYFETNLQKIVDFVEQTEAAETVKEKTNGYRNLWFISELDEQLDNFYTTFSSDFKFDTWAKTNSLSMQSLNIISAYYTPIKEELEMASTTKNKDAQIKEAYSCYSKAQIKKVLDFVSTFISGAVSIVDNRKRAKAPRKKRQPKIENIIKGLKYQVADNSLSITSLAPAKILDASQLITFNTKTRKISHYFAEDGKKFSIKGSTLLNVDLSKSIEKTLRKPHEILPSILKATRREIPKIIARLSTVEGKIDSGRINKNQILLLTFS